MFIQLSKFNYCWFHFTDGCLFSNLFCEIKCEMIYKKLKYPGAFPFKGASSELFDDDGYLMEIKECSTSIDISFTAINTS